MDDLATRHFHFGGRMRREMLPIARKVYSDLRLLADEEPEGPEVLRILEGILAEAERWYDGPAGLHALASDRPDPLPSWVNLPPSEVSDWARNMKELSVVMSRLGTYCHFQLKPRRKEEARHDGVVKPPLLAPAGYAELKLKNHLLNDLEVLVGRTRLSSFPHRMALDPTNECNLRCRGCRHGITKDFHHMELRREYVEVLAQALPFADYVYPYGTGEPVMGSTLRLLMAESARHGVKVDLLTNGTIIEKANLPWEQFHRIGISVDGASEETMRALRPVAPLAHVLKELRWLREHAPQATIYTKVTVSRMNYEEIPQLVEILADAGVNEVIVHSLEANQPVHDFIQVRDADRQHMLECVERAQEAAGRRGVRFVNALNFEAAAQHDDQAPDKPAMFQMLKDTPLPVLKIRELPGLLEELRKLRFAYYPESYVRATGLTPKEPQEAPRPETARIDTIDGMIRELLEEARRITPENVKLPFCFIPWKMSIVEADGRGKACCHLDVKLDDLDHAREFQDFWSGPGYAGLRESMFQLEKMPEKCAGCSASERSMLADGTIALADMLGMPVRMAARHPAPANVAALLKETKRPAAVFETLGARQLDTGTFVLPPNGQILTRFPNPKVASGVYYQGKFSIRGGRVLAGVKPLWAADLWQHMLDEWLLRTLGEWISLPMPPLTIDFSTRSEEECCVFLWAPGDNTDEVTVKVRDMSAVVTAPGSSYGDSLQNRHFWSGTNALDAVSCVES